jgi:hypothetical protein
VSTSKAHRLLAAGVGAVIAGALVAGCSSSNKTASTSGPTGVATTAAGGSSAVAGSTVTPSDDGAASGNASAEPTKSFAAGSGKGSKFCSQLETIDEQQSKLDPGGDTPADVKKSIQEIESLKGPLVGSAPSEIKGDLTTMFDYISKLDDVLSKAGYDWTKINPADLASFEGNAQQFETAAENVDNYAAQACGIDTGDSDDGASPSS